MKNRYPTIAALMFLAVISASSNAEKSPEPMPMKDMGMQHSMGGMGMGGMMAGMTEEQKDQHMHAMQEHMLSMHDLSNQILAEKDATKKAQLKAQQLELMKAHHAQMMEHHPNMKHTPKK